MIMLCYLDLILTVSTPTRYIDIRCHTKNDFPDKEGNSCTKGSLGNPHAHTVAKWSNDNDYGVIVSMRWMVYRFDFFQGEG